MGAQIVGISVDSHFSNAVFRDKLGLRFPLLSDFNRQIMGHYTGYFDQVAGRYDKVNRRRILVIDSQMMVRWQWTASIPGEIPDTEPVREAVQEAIYG